MIADRFDLTGRVAIVTGAGKGVGAGCALGFAEASADVALAAANDWHRGHLDPTIREGQDAPEG